MARRPVTLQVDEALVDATQAAAKRAGVPADELYERALRNVLATDFAELMSDISADQSARGAAIDDEDGVELAYDELKALRSERRNAS